MRQSHLILAIAWAVALNLLFGSPGFAQQRLSDAALRIAVAEELRSDARFRSVPVEFEVSAGVVTLKGILPSYYERSRIERLCSGIRGVRRVNNRILVRPFDAMDDQVEGAIEQRLASDATTRTANVSVKVSDGVATLSGDVATVRERNQAEYIAKQVRGVRAVRNHLGVKPESSVAANGKTVAGPSDQEISTLLTSILQADPQLRGFPITFTVREGVVTIQGEVVSPRQQYLIRVAAQRIPGVRQVIDDITINESVVPQDAQHDPGLTPEQLAAEIQGLVSLMMESEPTSDPTASEIAVMAADGKIVMRGNVASLFQKQQLLRQARLLAPLTPIQDDLKVESEQREDTAVKADLDQLFATDAVLSNEKISVSVSTGEVTLQGEVSLLIDKNRATQLATRVRGVQDLKNQLVVRTTSDVNDEELVKSIRAKLLRTGRTAELADQLQISSKQGQVTLKGEIPDWTLRGEIGAMAAQTDGARGVENLLRVKPSK